MLDNEGDTDWDADDDEDFIPKVEDCDDEAELEADKLGDCVSRQRQLPVEYSTREL